MRYRKVSSCLWNDAKFLSLPDDSKLVWLFLLTHPHMTSIGAMRASVSGLASELRWTLKRFRNAFDMVLETRMAEYDDTCFCLVLPNFPKHNPPANPNVVVSWNTQMELVPECELKYLLGQRLKLFLKGFSEKFQEAFETLSKPFRKQEHEQEQEHKHDQEQEEKPLSSSQANSTAEIDRVVERYRVHHPRARPGDKERRLIRDRLKDGYSADDLCACIDGYHESPYHLGDNDRSKKYLSLGLFMRDSDHVHEGMKLADGSAHPQAPNLSPASRRSLEAGQRYIDRMEQANG